MRPAPGRPLVELLSTVPRDEHGAVDVDRCLAALDPCDLLESSRGDGWTYLVPHEHTPILVDDGNRTRLRLDGHALDLGNDPFAALESWCDVLGLAPTAPTEDGAPPFSGGLVGAFGYDLARRIERIPSVAANERSLPQLHLRVAELVVAVDPHRRSAQLVIRPLIDVPGRPPATSRAAAVADRLRHAPPPRRVPRPAPQVATTALPPRRHRAAIETALSHIAAGNVFQVNLAQKITAPWPGDVHDLYLALRSESPAPYGAVLPEIGVASISPEAFLLVDGPQVTTRPIKGTRPRSSDAALDAALADDLATAAKDRAENVMVVDLERNDIGRVSTTGSIRTPRLAELEAHPTVWHLVSSVVGELRHDVGYGELLRATFPCGSITGAPKVAAMRLIEELEPARRGWYCGAIGFLSPGHARLSVAIRTATLHPDGTAEYAAGGGIVADSDPDEEILETLDKAAAFLRAVGATELHPGSPIDSTTRLGVST